MYGLSFSDAFFFGDGTEDYYSMPPAEYPTNVLQAIISLDEETKKGIARDVLGVAEDCLDYAINAESFAADVIDKVKETDLCDDLSSPVTVYIDDKQNYSVTIYEEDGPRKPYFVSTD